MPDAGTTTVPTFCALCVSRCGATATITDGQFVALGPDPRHPTGPVGRLPAEVQVVLHRDEVRQHVGEGPAGDTPAVVVVR